MQLATGRRATRRGGTPQGPLLLRFTVSLGVLLALAPGIAACGARGPSSEAVPAVSNAAAAWLACLESHGVTVPSANAMAHQVPAGGKGPLPLSQKPVADASVQAACAAYLPPMSQQLEQQWQNFAACIRTHGIPAPDPSFSSNGVMSLVYPPGVGPSMPGFSAAESSCMQTAGLRGAP